MRYLEMQVRHLASLGYEERDRRLADIIRDFDHLMMAETPDSTAEVPQQSYEEETDKSEELSYGKPEDFTVGEHGTVSMVLSGSSRVFFFT